MVNGIFETLSTVINVTVLKHHMYRILAKPSVCVNMNSGEPDSLMNRGQVQVAGTMDVSSSDFHHFILN
jgi:hypothetical protein